MALRSSASLAVAACCFLATLPYRVAAPTHVKGMDLIPYLHETPPTPMVDMKLCNLFHVVEKPYYILFSSCWLCALMQQLIDYTRNMEGKHETLGNIQKIYVGAQLVTLIKETFGLAATVGWLDGGSLWSMYNLYVYIFVHSSVFVRSVMMSMIVWDWYEAKLLKRPVFSPDLDGKGFSDSERAMLLVCILQFGSSACVMAVILLSHLLPALLFYHWIFLLVAAFVIKVRSWLSFFVDPDSRVGRGLVMASNSFVAIVGLQIMITSMVRVYEGVQSTSGYFAPILDDVASRDIETWYECHLSAGWGAFSDQDFLNLFVR